MECHTLMVKMPFYLVFTKTVTDMWKPAVYLKSEHFRQNKMTLHFPVTERGSSLKLWMSAVSSVPIGLKSSLELLFLHLLLFRPHPLLLLSHLLLLTKTNPGSTQQVKLVMFKALTLFIFSVIFIYGHVFLHVCIVSTLYRSTFVHPFHYIQVLLTIVHNV